MSVPRAEAAWSRARLGTTATRRASIEPPESIVQPEPDALRCGPEMDGLGTENADDFGAVGICGIVLKAQSGMLLLWDSA